MLDTADQDWDCTPKANNNDWSGDNDWACQPNQNEDWACTPNTVPKTADSDWAPAGILVEQNQPVPITYEKHPVPITSAKQPKHNTNTKQPTPTGTGAMTWSAFVNCGCTPNVNQCTPNVNLQFPVSNYSAFGATNEMPVSAQTSPAKATVLSKNITSFERNNAKHEIPEPEARDDAPTRGDTPTMRDAIAGSPTAMLTTTIEKHEIATSSPWAQRVNKARRKKKKARNIAIGESNETNNEGSLDQYSSGSSDRYSHKDDSAQVSGRVKRGRSPTRNRSFMRSHKPPSQPRGRSKSASRPPNEERRARSKSPRRTRETSGRDPPITSKEDEMAPRNQSPTRVQANRDSSPHRRTRSRSSSPRRTQTSRPDSSRADEKPARGRSPRRKDKLATVTIVERRNRSRSMARSTKSEQEAQKAARELARSMEQLEDTKAHKKTNEVESSESEIVGRSRNEVPSELDLPSRNGSRLQEILAMSEAKESLEQIKAAVLADTISKAKHLERTASKKAETNSQTTAKINCSPCSPRIPGFANEEGGSKRSEDYLNTSTSSTSSREEGIEMVPFVSNDGAPGLMIVNAGEWILSNSRKVRSKSPPKNRRVRRTTGNPPRPPSPNPNKPAAGRRMWSTSKKDKKKKPKKFPSITIPLGQSAQAAKRKNGRSSPANSKVDIEALGEVIDAVTKFRNQASKLGISEQDLLDAISSGDKKLGIAMASSSVSSLTRHS